jgi:hypothetical protein
MCRALYERAFTLACETRIHIDASDDNAASCFFLDVLERRGLSPADFTRYLMQRLTVNETTSRPWAVAYVSHSRILAGPRDEAGPRQRGVWTGFLVWGFFFDFAISFWTVFRWPRLLRQRHEGCLFSCMFLSFKYRFNELMFFSTHTDQLLMSGSEPPPLPQLFQALQAMHQTSKKASNIVFTAVVPCSFFPPRYILFLTDSYRYVPCYHPCS